MNIESPDLAAGVQPIQALPLHELEAAAGLLIGTDELTTFALGPSDETPLEAMVAVIAEVLARGPTYVSFSGGRDSSAVLAAATLAARRHGLPEPIPITQRFAGFSATDETRFQRAVIEHLKLSRWELVEIGEDLDLLGELAQSVLRRHGLLWPPNTHFHALMFRRARGCSFLTGFDGDGIFGHWRWFRARAVLAGRVRPQWRDVPRVALACAPAAIRRRLMPRPILSRAAPWLRPQAAAWLDSVARRQDAAEPRRWDAHLAHHGRSRFLRVTTHSLRALAADYDVEMVFPILHPRFVSALAATGGGAGFGDRTAVMRAAFPGTLPEELIRRTRKAEFGAATWRTAARAFAEKWDGTGVDLERIDPDKLRAVWRMESPYFGSSTLLQQAWLAAQQR